MSESLRPWASRCAVTSLSQAPARQVNTTVRKRRNWERNKDSCKETRKTSLSKRDNSLVKLGSSRAAMKDHRAPKKKKGFIVSHHHIAQVRVFLTSETHTECLPQSTFTFKQMEEQVQ